MRKVGKSVLCGLGVVIMVWGLTSWGDVIVDNSAPHPSHSEYNMFTVIENK